MVTAEYHINQTKFVMHMFKEKQKKSALYFYHSEIQRDDSFFNQLQLISSNKLKRRDRNMDRAVGGILNSLKTDR
jgi:hypothetical protein